MSKSAQRIADALRNMAASMHDSVGLQAGYVEFVEVETEDADLSQVMFEERLYRWVPKATPETFALGDILLVLMGGGLPMTIINKVLGDTSLATDGSED